jgi:hypothetical protein
LSFEDAVPLYAPLPLAIRTRGEKRTRRVKRHEALQAVLGALGTASHVKALNRTIDHIPVAIALIPHAKFGEDQDGNTTLLGEMENKNK